MISAEPLDHYVLGSRPYGLSFGQWTAKWWQWLLSIPIEINPASDDTGENAGVNQTDPNVWFLAGTFGETAVYETHKPVYRKCVIPKNRSILFPVINYEMNSLEMPTLKTEVQLIEHVREDMDDIISLRAVIDGVTLPVYRVKSDPPMFTVRMPKNNPFKILGGGTTRATSDGFWVFLKPLSSGKHDINFEGSCSSGKRRVKAGYHLEVST